VSVQIHLAGFTPTKSVAQVAVLAGPLGAMNTGDKTDTIVSKQSEWQHQIKDGNARFTFAPYSFTIIRFE
jgi:alpha-L-arabinofuranosidase